MCNTTYSGIGLATKFYCEVFFMNEDIRNYAKKKNVYLWMIANKLGMNDGNFSRKLRNELSPEMKEKVFKYIDEICEERK